MQVILREILDADVKAIADIERECFALPWSEGEIVSACKRADFCGVVAQIDNQVVAYLLGLSLFENAEVLRIAVKKEFRGKKLGATVLDSFFEKVKARGAETVFLEVRVSNLPAIRLYESRAFTRGRVREKYYENGESAVEMHKRLL